MKKLWIPFKKVWKFILLLILILLTFSYAMFQGGFVSWFLFYSFLPFAIYCVALSFYSLKDLEVTRVLPKTDYNAGEPLKVMVTIKRSRKFPLFYLLIEDVLDETLKYSPGQQKAKALLLPGLKKEFSYEYIIDELPRGEHFFRSFTLRIGDPLGLFEKEKKVTVDDKVIVYPAYSEFIYRPFENQYDQGLTASRERVQRDTTMAVGVRDYQPGDRFSWINWKSSAKRNEIMTKEFEQRQSHDVFVVMDCVPDKRFEPVVSFTASLLRAILKKGAQTGLLTISKERASFPIRGGERHLQGLFYHLAKIEAKCATPLEKVLETDGLFIQQSVSFMLVTAQLTKQLVEKASFLGQRKGSITLFLIKGQKEAPMESERSLIAIANARGVRVIMVHEGEFAAAFSGVSIR
ncbi:DUF58 domain-containing protein [Neobacillus vireti]|uniref:DUF58 domain-containing protein n=1 Tax=Neobacillus vireti LMG 21834 TaxID=1131730 RepID=A0AB94IKY8_9BACI|nr:DUF58 domain-containing protein [Neobacillus vireti]ETI67699.1 hypothetical protein BAVI_16297 [Neobacillus vireti LMG 21834]KLT18213.1 hypothetical protein AA980_07655 [Neobacillus vireti]